MAPFRYDAPDNRFGATIAEMLAHQGDAGARAATTIAAIQGQGREQGAQIWGNAIGNIGQSVATALDPTRRRALQLQERQQALKEQQLGMEGQRLSIETKQAQSGLDEKERQRQARTAVATAMSDTPMNADGTYDLDAIAKKVPPAFATDVEPHLKQLASINQSLDGENQRRRTEATKVAGQLVSSGAWQDPVTMDAFVATLSNNGLITADQRDAFRQRLRDDPEAGQQIAKQFVMPGKVEDVGPGHKLVQDGKVLFENPAERKTATVNGQIVDTQTGEPIGQPVPPQVTPAQDETARHNKEQERIALMTAGRTEASAAETRRHNLATEENARNTKTSRPMLSGDANRIADIDVGLKQAFELSTAIQGKTGTGSWLGTQVPDFVTNTTGLGAESKRRQAVIERVKQIIGKAMEGGVLRKEDEVKYAKILPTISDESTVVKEKLDGLAQMLKDQRDTKLESLSDSGFNVAAHQQRGAPQAPATGKIRARDPQGKLHEADAGTPLPSGWKPE